MKKTTVKNKAKSSMKPAKKNLSKKSQSYRTVKIGLVLLAALLFAFVGAYLIFGTKAASNAFASEEAEGFVYGQNVWKVPDPAASADFALKMTGNVSVEKTVSLESKADSLGFTLKGQSCKGSPTVSIFVDGAKIATVNISNTSWAEQNFARALAAGQHIVKVQFNNHYSTKRCERTLSFDKLTFYAQPVTTTPPVTSTPPPTDTQFQAVFDPSINATAGWQYQLSGANEKIAIVNQRAECSAGGYAASTHYARVRRQLPEQDDFAAKKDFVIRANFELPSDFYTQQESYVRFFNTDNFPGKYKSTGATVGAASADEWRVGFLVYGGDKLPRLISAHENHESLTLWQGSQRLSVGRHQAELRFTPSQGSSGSWELYIDGVKMGGQTGVKTVPSTLVASEVAVTRVVGCIDGAADQDTKVMRVNLYSLILNATK